MLLDLWWIQLEVSLKQQTQMNEANLKHSFDRCEPVDYSENPTAMRVSFFRSQPLTLNFE